MPKANLEDYHIAFEVSDTGRRVLEDMMEAHHFMDSSFTPDPYTTAFNEGERNVVLRILTVLDQHKKGEKVDGKVSDG